MPVLLFVSFRVFFLIALFTFPLHRSVDQIFNLIVSNAICHGIKLCFAEMQFFSCNIYRDLAARNILVFSKSKVKISDFGLSRALGVGKDYYQTNFNVNLKLPIAWWVIEFHSRMHFWLLALFIDFLLFFAEFVRQVCARVYKFFAFHKCIGCLGLCRLFMGNVFVWFPTMGRINWPSNPWSNRWTSLSGN